MPKRCIFISEKLQEKTIEKTAILQTVYRITEYEKIFLEIVQYACFYWVNNIRIIILVRRCSGKSSIFWFGCRECT